MAFRIGQGYDVHRLAENRPLMLGGVEVPHPLGLMGHSDADVLCHAVIDALLGASGLGDIGLHFPDTYPQYKNMSGLSMLNIVADLLAKNKYTVENIDATIIAQEPKLTPYKEKMAENISRVMKVPAHAVNIKATTEEGLGFTGAGEGIAAQAVCLLRKVNEK
ncbi:MAG: 2-C-methyl-D-erythritol 2,4-cyclodiphosphate synthase [Defluviitaleaceae bacterium]|nr:2-C-methyl-D-erythritol 2,4-cyclodiphosphate synthase [Defluviitaleaceae bacterium]